MSETFDRRVTPMRGDVAAAHLKGKVAAKTFVDGRPFRAVKGKVSLKAFPADDAGLETELLFGETFIVYGEERGWVWGQALLDSYVGYARQESLAAAPDDSPTHRVTALSTPLLTAPDVKKPARDMLPLNAKLVVAEAGNRFYRLTNGLWVFARHIASIGTGARDWVGVAERFLGVPYLWGGKTAAGIDCSGLVQTAAEAGGLAAPRDTDMQEATFGERLPSAEQDRLCRGDLVFWKGHVGVMLDAVRLLHANAFHMEVAIEPLATARARIRESDDQDIRAIRRLRPAGR